MIEIIEITQEMDQNSRIAALARELTDLILAMPIGKPVLQANESKALRQTAKKLKEELA